jgi:hypothetical protein
MSNFGAEKTACFVILKVKLCAPIRDILISSCHAKFIQDSALFLLSEQGMFYLIFAEG